LRVVLYQPKDGNNPWPPIQLMVLARALREGDHDVEIVDGRLGVSYPDADLVGVSALTGNQIMDGLEFSGHYPDTPVVWGGWHPTLLPEETVANDLVDYVVEGQGHEALLKMANEEDDAEIPGLWWKDYQGIHRNDPAPYTPFEYLPRPDWNRVNLQRYFDLMPMGRRELPYMASDGCVYRCGYCSIGYLKHKWSGVSPLVVQEELRKLKWDYDFDEVWLCDDLFFLNRPWSEDFCGAIRDTGLRWHCSSRADIISKIPEEYLVVARESGLYKVILGIESGSNATLKRINKGTTVAQNFGAIKRLSSMGFDVGCHFLFGTPGETRADADLTLRFIRKILLNRSIKMLSLYYYTPYPGTDLFDRWVEGGGRPPVSLAEWGRVGWHRVEDIDPYVVKRVERLRSFLKRRLPGKVAYAIFGNLF